MQHLKTDSGGLKHRASAFGAAAIASKQLLQLFRSPVGRLQPVVEEQLNAGFKVSASKDENASILFVCFAVRLTRMINPLCFVAADRGIDHIAVVKGKENGVMRIPRINRG